MIFDTNNLLSDKQVITANAASTNVYDRGATGTPYGAAAALADDLGKGEGLEFLVQLTADATGTSPTLDVALQVSSDASTWTTVASYQFTGGSAGDRWPFRFVPEGVDQRYIRMNYTVGGTSPVYKVTAGPVAAVQTNS